MAYRMSNLDYIINFEMFFFTEAVSELPEDVGEDVSAAVLDGIIDTVKDAFLSKEKRVVPCKFRDSKIKNYKKYKVLVAGALDSGTILCEKIARCVLSSPNYEEDYEKLLGHYFQRFPHLVNMLVSKNYLKI